MTTLRPSDGHDEAPRKALLDVRAAVILLLAAGLSIGAGITVGILVLPALGAVISVVAGLSSGGAAAVLLLPALNQTIE